MSAASQVRRARRRALARGMERNVGFAKRALEAHTGESLRCLACGGPMARVRITNKFLGRAEPGLRCRKCGREATLDKVVRLTAEQAEARRTGEVAPSPVIDLSGEANYDRSESGLYVPKRTTPSMGGGR